MERATKRFKNVVDRDRENRRAALEDTKFVYVAGNQWPEDVRAARALADDPCLEFPQLKQFVNQVINDQRQNRPGIRVHAAAGQGSKEVAEILQGMVRHIEYDSNAEAAYDGGFQHAVVGGRGYWRIVTEYEASKSFNQKICIRRIPDPQTVYMDVDFQEPDGSDSNYCFVTEELTEDEFEERYPKADALSWEQTELTNEWYTTEEKVIIADYFERIGSKRTLVMMSDGAQGWKDELPKTLPPGVSIVNEREADDYKICWYKLAGGEQVLETIEWPGTMIPIICCMGDEIMIDGKRIFQGLIRQARDAQVMYNYEQTQKLVLLSLSPRVPYIAAEGAIEGYEEVWKNANKRSYSVLPYKTTDVNGNPLPMPQRTAFPPVATGWVEAAQQSKDDIKSVIGMYQNNLGMHGQETSGRAILAREKQGDNATFHFADNLARAIALTGKIIVELIPKYYDTERMVTTVAVDDTRKNVMVNQQMPDPNNPYQAIKNNDLTVGEYSVVVESGPSFATKRQETSETMLALIQSYPPLMQVAGDLVVGAMDFADADQLAERIKVMLPPPIQAQIQAKAQEAQPGGVPPEVQAQVQGMQQQFQQQAQQMQQALQQLQAENQQLKAGTQQKEQASMTDAQVKMAVAQLDAQTRKEIAAMQLEGQLIIKGSELQAQQQPVIDAAEQTAEAGPGLSDVMQAVLALAQNVHGMAQVVAAPRRHSFTMDQNGNVIGGESAPNMPTVQ